MKIKSLRFKINIAILLTSTLIAIIYVTILYPFETARHESYVRKVSLLLSTVFDQKKEELANELFARQKRALMSSMEDMLRVEGVVAVTVFLPDGETFLSTHEAFAGPLTSEEIKTLPATPSAFNPQYLNAENRTLGAYTREIEVIGLQVGFIRFFYDFAELERETRSSIVIFTVLLILTIALMIGLLNLLLAQFVIRPVSVLRGALHKLQEGRLGETVVLASGDEIGEVGNAFNEMSVELKRSQEALAQAEEKYRGIFENAIEGIFQSTPGKGQYLTVNPSMVRMMGYDTQAELIASITDIAHQLFVDPGDHEKFERMLQEQGRIVGFETQLYRKDGGTIWVSASARSVRDASGSVQYYEGSFIDVTERREKEQAEREREAAEAASKAKSEFLANMSHEIRTPMNAILGFSDLLSSVVADPRQKNYLESIRSSGKNLMSLINDILDLSKIEAGKMEIKYDSVSLRDLFAELERVFSLTIKGKGLELSTDIDPDIPDRLLLDEVRMRQVLFNLLGNAVKFTETGWIKLSAGLGANTGGEDIHLVIAVEDTGIGIQSQAHNEIFESFKQQSGQNLKLYGGTGLGLTISKSFVEMMGGSILVRSRVGKGSVFEIHLPHVSAAMPPEPSSPRQTQAMERISSSKGMILVVDDTELNRNLVRELLESSNIEVIEAENGQSAVLAAKEHRPDMILMDIKMPVMDGYEAMRHLREDDTTNNIPVIALTASGMREDVERLQEEGFDAWLLQPFERSDLVEMLSRFIKLREIDSGSPKEKDSFGAAISKDPPILTSEEKETVVLLLEHELKEQWEDVRRKQRIADIEEFGHRIKTLGNQYGIKSFSAFAENLLFHVGSFDIESIQRTLNAFPELVEAIKNLQPR